MMLKHMLRWSTFPSVLAATMIQAAEPVLLQGQADPETKAKAWYNSRDPEVLSSQIRLLEETLQDQRRSNRQLEAMLDTVRTKNLKLQSEIRKRRPPSASVDSGPSPEIKTLSAELANARQRILDLESEIVDQAAQPLVEAAAPAAEDGQTRELKALVRTYEKTIASLENELQSIRQELEPEIPAEETPPSASSAVEAEDAPGQNPLPALVQPKPVADRSGSVSVQTLLAPTTEFARPDELALPPAPAAPEILPAGSTGQESADAKQASPPLAAEERNDASRAATTDAVNRGFSLLMTGKTPEAEEIFLQIDEEDPEYGRAQLGLATVEYSRDSLSAARNKLRTILDKTPDNPQALGLSGIISWREGRISEADKALNRAILLDSQDAQLHNYRAIVLHARGDYLSAENSLQTAIALNPEHAEAHFNLAVLNTIGPMANRTKAQEYYEKAVLLGSQRDPKFEASLYPR